MEALTKTMLDAKTTASRRPVSISHTTRSLAQNSSICKVEEKTGVLRDVAVVTYRATTPSGALP